MVTHLAPQDAYRHGIPFIFYHWYNLPGHFLVWTGKQVALRAAAWLHCTDGRGQNRDVRGLSPPGTRCLNPVWLSNGTSCNMWDETRYTFQSFTDEVFEWIRNFISLYNGCDLIWMLGFKLFNFSKRDPRCLMIYQCVPVYTGPLLNKVLTPWTNCATSFQ